MQKILLLLSIVILSSCSLNPRNIYKPPPAPPSWVAPLPSIQPHDGKLSDLEHWWQQFNDPLLLQLIDDAQKISPDIASAKDRVVAARSAVTIADAQLLPNVTSEASVSRNRDSLLYPSGFTANVGVSASWELDVWGKNKADQSEEHAKLTGINAMWHEARVIVAAETAKQYVNYRLCENLVLVSIKNVDSTKETARLSELTANAGLLAPSNASQSEAQAAEASNQLRKQQLQCALILKSLVALSAIPELQLKEMLDKNNGKMPMPEGIEVTAVPATILAQRPDVLNAERNVASASFEIVSAEGQRYPRLSLGGNIGLGYDSRRFGAVKRRTALDGLTWSIGPIAVSLPLFDAGVREADIAVAKAQYETAKITYEAVARNAVREVEESLVTLNSTASRLEDVTKSAEGFKVSFEATQRRYKSDLANLFDLEEARRASLQAEINLLGLENERVLAWISLYRAMGGGWTATQNTRPENTPSLIFDTELKQADTNIQDAQAEN